MADYKYIMVSVDGRELPIIFPDLLVHQDVARATVNLMARTFRKDNPEIVSAGFISSLGIVGVTGRSESLDVASRPEDASAINCLPYTNGVQGALLMETPLLLRHIEMVMERIKGK